MDLKMTMRKKMILFFIFLAIIPIGVIYFVSSHLFTSNAKKDLLNIYSANITEVGRSADIFFNNALDVSIYPLMDNTIKKYLDVSIHSDAYDELKKNANDILMTMPYGYSTGIYGIRLMNLDHDSISTGSIADISSDDIRLAKSLNSKPYWDYSDTNPQNGHIYFTRLLRNPNNLNMPIGYIKLSLSCSQLANTLKQNQTNSDIEYFMITPDNQYLLDEDRADISSETVNYDSLSSLSQAASKSVFVNNSIVSAYKLGRTDIVVYSVTPDSALTITTTSFSVPVLIVLILVLLFSILLAIAFSKIITKPLSTLGTYMTSISNEDFTVRYPVRGDDEIAVLTTHFNQMAEKLETLYTQVYLSEIKLKQSQLDILQTQINPHFLYNTLDTIYWMSKMKASDKVAVMVSNLSKMMRMTLSAKPSETMTLRDELEHVHCYVAIQEIRYKDKITFHIDCEEELLDNDVLSFLLQPLVENALIHGLKDSLHGLINIRIYEGENTVVYDVSNNGTPIDIAYISGLLETPENSLRGFALRNLNDRLILKYGAHYGLQYFIENGFSIFRIIQPWG